MIYYYAFSSHKFGLDCVRRGVAMVGALKKQGQEAQLIVNDFRAGLAAKDLGVADAVTIETILDVDAVAQRGDAVILDTPEDTNSRMERYAAEFSPLVYVTDRCDYRSLFGEIVLKPFCDNEELCIQTPIIDSRYTQEGAKDKKEERILFFYGDADYDKNILSHADFFGDKGMDLLMGHYFFVKYENDLSKLFHHLIEPEEYAAMLSARSRIITASKQCALEARAAGANVAYMQNSSESECALRQLVDCGITLIENFKKIDFNTLFEAESEKKPYKGAENIARALFGKPNL